MIQFVIALHCEASPIIQHYRMKPCGNHGRAQFFQGENARLVVTGVGSLSAAIAVTAMGERFPSKDAPWLNVGICGGVEVAIGDTFIGNKITSDHSRDALYPQLSSPSPWQGIGIKTLSTPSSSYKTDWVFDMEAFGFYTAALSFANSENIQCIKIVSDNSSNPAGKHFDKTKISTLVASQIPNIEMFLKGTEYLGEENCLSAWANDLLEAAKVRFSFSETERHQLLRRTRQIDALFGEDESGQLQALLNEGEKNRFLAQLQLKIDKRSPQRVC